jgi:dTDP-4-dehydrorhamnose reductase
LLPVTRASVDITDGQAIHARVVQDRPDVVVNTAAYNHVDPAEDQAVEALRVNALAVRAMARACADVGATLVHYGSDFVFRGDIDRPYSEDDEPAHELARELGRRQPLGLLTAERRVSHGAAPPSSAS